MRGRASSGAVRLGASPGSSQSPAAPDRVRSSVRAPAARRRPLPPCLTRTVRLASATDRMRPRRPCGSPEELRQARPQGSSGRRSGRVDARLCFSRAAPADGAASVGRTTLFLRRGRRGVDGSNTCSQSSGAPERSGATSCVLDGGKRLVLEPRRVPGSRRRRSVHPSTETAAPLRVLLWPALVRIRACLSVRSPGSEPVRWFIRTDPAAPVAGWMLPSRVVDVFASLCPGVRRPQALACAPSCSGGRADCVIPPTGGARVVVGSRVRRCVGPALSGVSRDARHFDRDVAPVHASRAWLCWTRVNRRLIGVARDGRGGLRIA